MDGNGKLDELIRMVQEMRDEVKALREELERNRAGVRTSCQSTSSPYQSYRIERLGPHVMIGAVDQNGGDQPSSYVFHAHGISRSSGYTTKPQLSDDETMD